MIIRQTRQPGSCDVYTQINVKIIYFHCQAEIRCRNTLPYAEDMHDDENISLRLNFSGYLKWATDSFLLATAIAEPKTSIHTHMCYCDFGDCMEAIDRLDADVNSIENGALPQTPNNNSVFKGSGNSEVLQYPFVAPQNAMNFGKGQTAPDCALRSLYPAKQFIIRVRKRSIAGDDGRLIVLRVHALGCGDTGATVDEQRQRPNKTISVQQITPTAVSFISLRLLLLLTVPPTALRQLKTARSDNTTLQSFKAFDYKKGLGPGLYDIHSPVVPPVAVLQEKLEGDKTISTFVCVQIWASNEVFHALTCPIFVVHTPSLIGPSTGVRLTR